MYGMRRIITLLLVFVCVELIDIKSSELLHLVCCGI